MFWCLPPSGKCEWSNLRKFAEQFNDAFSTKYRLSKCLDISDSSKPQPEVLLESVGDKCMVIERKAIVWPRNYLKYHRSEHDFSDSFTPQVSPLFQDDTYLLEISTKHLRGNKAYLQDLAKQIAKMVIAQQAQIMETGATYSSRPIRWRFRQVQEHERDSDTPEKGVGIAWLSENKNDEAEKAQQGISVIIDDFLNEASLKFTDYPDCLRILVLEAYGDLNEDNVVEQSVQKAVLPQNVDQIWLAEPTWISDIDFEVAYRQVRNNATN